MEHDELAALAAELEDALLPYIYAASHRRHIADVQARMVLESEWLREHDARVAREAEAAIAPRAYMNGYQEAIRRAR